jgi:hypothetical protein
VIGDSRTAAGVVIVIYSPKSHFAVSSVQQWYANFALHETRKAHNRRTSLGDGADHWESDAPRYCRRESFAQSHRDWYMRRMPFKIVETRVPYVVSPTSKRFLTNARHTQMRRIACGCRKRSRIIPREGSHSGLVRLSRKQLGVQAPRGFESHPLRVRRGRLVGLGRIIGNDVGASLVGSNPTLSATHLRADENERRSSAVSKGGARFAVASRRRRCRLTGIDLSRQPTVP